MTREDLADAFEDLPGLIPNRMEIVRAMRPNPPLAMGQGIEPERRTMTYPLVWKLPFRVYSMDLRWRRVDDMIWILGNKGIYIARVLCH